MTLKELSQLYYINREIERDQERLEQLRTSVSAPGAPNYDGMPKSPSFENRLERYIAEIPDSLTRQIFQLRFINGLTWTQIAFSVGGGNTEEGVRKRVYRYLEQENKGEK